MAFRKDDPNYIKLLLAENDRAVERAIVAIYRRQTEDEKEIRDTRHRNGRGFRVNHAKSGSRYAEWVIKGNRLTGEHLTHAREIAFFYIQQLTEVAKSNLTTQQ
jgi:hypothetical protein